MAVSVFSYVASVKVLFFVKFHTIGMILTDYLSDRE